MNGNPARLFGCLLSLIFMIIACAGTDLSQKQVDEAYEGKPVSDILVIAITGNEQIEIRKRSDGNYP